MATIEHESTNVQNLTNTEKRWREALESYSVQSNEVPMSVAPVALKICLDISSSMEVSISTFASKIAHLTDKFVRVEDFRTVLPQLLAKMRANGSTACYDAIDEGMDDLAEYAEAALVNNAADPVETNQDKRVMVVLTDGEDTCSSLTSRDITSELENPLVDNFMFVLVAVEMDRNSEAEFDPWMQHNHCKQLSVGVKTGARLVKVFKEVLMSRVLSSAVSSARLYSRTRAERARQRQRPVPQASQPQRAAQPFTSASLISSVLSMGSSIFRSAPSISPASTNIATNQLIPDNEVDYDTNEDDEDDFGGRLSRNVSRCNSMSDDGLDRLLLTAVAPIRQTSDDMMSCYSVANSDDGQAVTGLRYSTTMMVSSRIDSRTASPVFMRRNSFGDDTLGYASSVDYNEQSSSSLPVILRARSVSPVQIVAGRAAAACSTSPSDRSSRLWTSVQDEDILSYLQHAEQHVAEARLSGVEEEPNFLCPITHARMEDPVVATDGITYERAAIEEWFQRNDTSPMTNLPLASTALVPNRALKNLLGDN